MKGQCVVETVRFEKFTLLIDGIHKCISKIKFDLAPHLGVKSVHVFWIYELLLHPEGLTATEIAAVSMVDRSLVSREIEMLKKCGYVTSGNAKSKRGYNCRFTLTKKGIELAENIKEQAVFIQRAADKDISEDELVSFYRTLEKLYNNFDSIASAETAKLSLNDNKDGENG